MKYRELAKRLRKLVGIDPQELESRG